MGKTITFSVDDVPPITDAERKNLLKLSEQNEGNIDFSDIPPLTEEFSKGAVRGRFYRPLKKQVTLRLDSNILDWFKRRTPKGYQTDINRVLADYVAAEEKKAG